MIAVYGHSQNRLVLRLGNVVLKLARSLHGLVCNLTEAGIWRRVSETDLAAYFVPVRWTNGLVLVMPYAGLTLSDWPEVSDDVHRAAACYGVMDRSPRNVAANWQGRQALLDYGLTPIRCQLFCPAYGAQACCFAWIDGHWRDPMEGVKEWVT
jgi:hypothetical protein